MKYYSERYVKGRFMMTTSNPLVNDHALAQIFTNVATGQILTSGTMMGRLS